MNHKEYIRILPEADTAVLFMHGIAGTPDHFRTLLPLQNLVPDDWSCCNILIEGHGKQVRDFSNSSMNQWKAQVMGLFEHLCATHSRVVIVGHSMGTLFAVQMALLHPEKVSFLFLIAVPMRVGVKAFGVRNLIRYAFGTLDMQDPVQEATSRVCSIPPTKRVWQYVGWIPRMLELIAEMHKTEKLLRDLRVPAIAYQSQRDELVAGRSRKLLEASGRVEVHELLRSTHFYYHPEDVQSVQKAFLSACDTYVQ